MAQKYLNEIKNGDNRIIIYNGIIEKNILTRYPPRETLLQISQMVECMKSKLLKKVPA